MKAPNVTAELCFWTMTLPKLGKAATRLSDNLSSDASAVQQQTPCSLTLVKRSCSS